MYWFTSDTHFGHENIITLCNRPFDDVNHMNEEIIENWNSVVAPNDTVFHLGDVAMGRIVESLPLVGRLNGRKILCPGNHDRIFSGNKQNYIERFRPQYDEVFSVIMPEICRMTIADTDVVISHFPYTGDSHDDDRYTDHRPVDEGLPLLHGHVHDAWVDNGRMLNVGVDVHCYRPISEDEVAAWLTML